MQKTLIVMAGPTASGKTATAIALANKLNTEIISADSRQFYREMAIGTAKPTSAELAQAKHHFIDSHSIAEKFTVADFEKAAMSLLNQLFEYHNYVIMVGGSGLYIKAVCEGMDDIPDVDLAIREKLNAELSGKGIAYLQEKLKLADPLYYAQVDLNNPQRIIRALEVIEGTGQPFSSFRTASRRTRPFDIVKYGLQWPREELYNRINLRVDQMVAGGLINEVKALLPYRHHNALNTVGYKEIFDYVDGKTDLNTAIALIKQNTRNFAKRQITWFNKDPELRWLSPAEVTELYC